MPYTQTALALDGAAAITPQPTPVTEPSLQQGGWASATRYTLTPSGQRLPDDFWGEYRHECAERERLHLPAVSLAEFRDLRDWSDRMEETDDDDDWITEPDDPPPYGAIRAWW